jgi:hypothetical protein
MIEELQRLLLRRLRTRTYTILSESKCVLGASAATFEDQPETFNRIIVA